MEHHSESHDTPPPPVNIPLQHIVLTTKTATPAEATAPKPRSQPSHQGVLLPKLVWLLVMSIFLSTVIFIGPPLAEKFQYSLTRGKQQAKYEIASVALKDRPLEQISWASQMVSQRVVPSVVEVYTQSSHVEEPKEDGASQFFHRRQSRGQGSGVIVDAEGYILTNYHVISNSNEVRVTLSNGRKGLPARVVGTDPLTDLAVLKIDADKLIAAKWGDSDEIDVGSLVWAVGSPFGLERSFTFGILSAKHRAGKAGTPFQDYLQSDAAVNPGNSGGPLVDSQGLVIGINTAIVGDTYQGVCFAIPSSVARNVYQRIKADGSVIRGWLGVQLDEVTPARAQELGLAEAKGVYVASLVENGLPSPAKKAGVKQGDVIVRWNDRATDTRIQLSQAVAGTDVGSKAALIVMRDGKELTLQVTVGRRPGG